MTIVMTMVTKHETEPRRMGIAEFRAKCLRLMDEVAETGVPIIITKRGTPVARLEPVPKAWRDKTVDELRALGRIDPAPANEPRARTPKKR